MGVLVKAVVIAIILAIIVPRIILLVQLMKYGKTVYNHQPGPCENIKGIKHGAEDMQAMANGMVLITSGMKFLVDTTQPHWQGVKGQVLIFDPSHPDKGAVPLAIKGDNLDMEAFNPHGISLWEENGVVSVYIINHADGVESVERFTFDPKKPSILVHEETIVSEAFVFPNDLVVVGPRQFYLTNYQRFRGGTLAHVEIYAGLKFGTVAYYNGTDGRFVADDFLLPNGINRSPDGRYIYLVHIGGEEVIVYDRKPNGDLHEKQVYKTPGAGDNLDVDKETGHLWLGVHPVPHLTLQLMQNPGMAAPSQVLKLKTKEGLITEAVEVYMEDGTRYVSGSSVAVRVDNKLMIGSINGKAVMCILRCG